MSRHDWSGKNARSSEKCYGTSTIAVLCLVLIVITTAIYWQVGNHTFFILDKNDHVTENPYIATGLTGRNIIWAFTSVAAFNWHPVTWLSHMTIAHFFGMYPCAHHIANAVIHIIASVGLFLLFLRVTGALWQSLFVAALFALHPLHVESVAWVAERKDVLSALFWFLTLFFYCEYVRKELKSSLFFLTLVCFILGLMSKSMLVTLPIVMLLMDFWPLERFHRVDQELGLRQLLAQLPALIKEKVPFLACSLATGVIAIYAQHKGGATKSLDVVPFMLRLENAVVAYVKYVIKTLWPLDLGVLYPLPSSFPLWQVISALLVLILISVGVVRGRHRHPFLVVGWFWFLITLLPVIGLIQVGSQSMADRYSYIPSIGLFIMAAWGIPVMTQEVRHQKILLALLGGAVIISSAALTWHQLGYWRDSVSIFRRTLQVTTDNYLVNDLLGMTFTEKGDLDAALREYQLAVRINPRDMKTRSNLGVVLSEKGDLDAAIREFQMALRLNPEDARIHYLLGKALAQKGDLDAALDEYRVILRVSPNDKNIRESLERVLALKQKQTKSRM